MAQQPPSEDRNASGDDDRPFGFRSSNSGGRDTGGTGSGSGSGGTGGTPNSAGAGDDGSRPESMEELLRQLSGLIGQTGQDAAGLDDMIKQVQQTLAQMGVSGGGLSGAGPIGFGNLGGLFGGTPPEGGVNWGLAKDTARKTSATLGPDPVPTSPQQSRIREAVSIAEVWLDDATQFPRVAGEPLAWSRAEWIESTQPVWQRLVEPVASSIADAMQQAMTPQGEEAAQLGGMEKALVPFVRSSGAGMFGIQLGRALAQLAGEVVGATDIGLPLHDRVALLPGGVEKFGNGLDQSSTDVYVYLALRECARQRLFHGTTWLRGTLLTLVEEYARGITIDTSAIEDAIGEIDLGNTGSADQLEELQDKLTGSLFTPQRTPEQQAVLVRLETLLALVEGWVDHVVARATARWMPAAVPLAETMRRHRATGGPAEATFASLVGLELRPRRLRDAANLWAALYEKRGADGRDAVWQHPDVMPATEDLDDPLGFVESGPRRDTAGSEAGAEIDFDAELAKLLDAANDPAPGDGSDPDSGPDDDRGESGAR